MDAEGLIRTQIQGIDFVRRSIFLGPYRLSFWVVEDPNKLYDAGLAEKGGTQQRLPFWAALWPASIGLGQYAVERGGVQGKKVLEIGCGLGVNAILAAKMGAKAYACDWFLEAVTSARTNASLNDAVVEAFWMDWNTPSLQRKYDHIIGSDVLYEVTNHLPVLDLLDQILEPDGEAWFSDPGRPEVEIFLPVAVSRGWATTVVKVGAIQVLCMKRA